MDKAEKYDIKEASNPNLDASARKNYADNAQHNSKVYDGPKMYNGPKMYRKSKGPHMESNGQEKSNLLSDNPIASRASGSWMSKHSKGGM